MNEQEWIKKLKAEGFTNIYVWHDKASAHYPPHTHSSLSAHIILEGEMTLIMNSNKQTFTQGERFDVPAGKTHEAIIGKQGCKYVIAEK